MGPFVGFLIGCFDSMSNIIFIAILVKGGCEFIAYAAGPTVSPDLAPLLWFILYAVCLTILIPLSRWNFHVITVTGAISVALCFLFIFSTIPNQNFTVNVLNQEKHAFFAGGGMKSFMQVLPMSTWMYIGIDLTCLVCDDTNDVCDKCLFFLIAKSMYRLYMSCPRQWFTL